MRQRLYGGIEAGGTKFVCVIGSGPDEIVESARIDVAGPAETIGAALAFFRRAVDAGVHLDAIGIGSFGPVELRDGHPRYGWITTTPKPGWSDTDLVGPVARELGLPVGFDTDVNAAALAEGRWGAARGLGSFIYLTMGTGIGGGAVAEGQLVHGLGHPEMGHLVVPRRPGDTFAGACPFHGDCFEGMASGPAVAARFGRRAETLDPADLAAATALVAFYLAAGVRSLVYALAPERVVVGGGLGTVPGLIEAARVELSAQLAGYPGHPEHDADAVPCPGGARWHGRAGRHAAPRGGCCRVEGVIRFDATPSAIETSTVLRLPETASRSLPSRGQVAVLGTINGTEFQTVLEPDGNAGHWMKVPDSLQEAADIRPGKTATLEIEVTKAWPEPDVPGDLATALASASEKVQDAWDDITPMARWEWVRWVNATRNPDTRERRVEVSISKLDHGKRRPCCFDLSSCTDPDLSRSGKLLES